MQVGQENEKRAPGPHVMTKFYHYSLIFNHGSIMVNPQNDVVGPLVPFGTPIIQFPMHAFQKLQLSRCLAIGSKEEPDAETDATHARDREFA
jgi:hypothetical protein